MRGILIENGWSKLGLNTESILLSICRIDRVVAFHG